MTDDQRFDALEKAASDILESGSITEIYEAVAFALNSAWARSDMDSDFGKRLERAIDINETAQNEVDR